ncbi:cytochrome c oxidase subunit 6A, mitochondrial-like [Palaemon carinicauda]|uniref:cytochrome c oxidase subunit 6A, mitochondrial-like n=1 Tax=Palaemon carinicauda TaxID=392227 RepID=UPI0035B68527
MAASLVRLSRRSFQTALLNASAKAEGHAGHGAAAMKQWKMVSILVAIPSVALCMVNAFVGVEHEAPPEFVAYEHLRLRNKRFPWGDGQKSLFHNAHVNALPDGYEEH